MLIINYSFDLVNKFNFMYPKLNLIIIYYGDKIFVKMQNKNSLKSVIEREKEINSTGANMSN